jgi:hypothetical protein
MKHIIVLLQCIVLSIIFSYFLFKIQNSLISTYLISRLFWVVWIIADTVMLKRSNNDLLSPLKVMIFNPEIQIFKKINHGLTRQNKRS